MNAFESEAIEASAGDQLIDKEEGIVHYAFQNINGISIREDIQLMPETAMLGTLQIDVAALSKTNVHWNNDSR